MNNFIFLNSEKQESLVFDAPGKYIVFFHNYSGTITCDLQAEGTDVTLLGLYTGTGKNDFSITTVQKHSAPRATSNLFIKGVFQEESRFHFSGLIRIEKEGQGTHAYQKNQNLMLSGKAFVQSEPFLEILANDVFCTHGSTTGKLNKEELFYVKSRGLTDEEAKDALVEGFKQEVLDIVQSHVTEKEFENVMKEIR